MIKRYRTICHYGEVENTIEKSRFIGYAKPVEREEEAMAFIEEIKLKHKNATHNVPVYILGYNNDIQRYSDDGEPSGTAGIPILDMLKKEDIKNTAIVVTRYFGGIKLGTGGLVRAYTQTAKLALAQALIIEKVLYDLVRIKIEYSILGKVQNEILNNGYYIKETIFDDAVNLYIYVNHDDCDQMITALTNLTSGRCELSIEDTLYLNELEGQIIKE